MVSKVILEISMKIECWTWLYDTETCGGYVLKLWHGAVNGFGGQSFGLLILGDFDLFEALAAATLITLMFSESFAQGPHWLPACSWPLCMSIGSRKCIWLVVSYYHCNCDCYAYFMPLEIAMQSNCVYWALGWKSEFVSTYILRIIYLLLPYWLTCSVIGPSQLQLHHTVLWLPRETSVVCTNTGRIWLQRVISRS